MTEEKNNQLSEEYGVGNNLGTGQNGFLGSGDNRPFAGFFNPAIFCAGGLDGTQF